MSEHNQVQRQGEARSGADSESPAPVTAGAVMTGAAGLERQRRARRVRRQAVPVSVSVSPATGKTRDKNEGVRSLLVSLMGLFTAVLTVLDKFLKAIDILRNPLIGLVVVLVAVGAVVISAGYVLLRPQTYSRWQRRLAAAGLVGTVVAGLAWGGWTLYDMARPPKGLIVLIADFEQSAGARSVDYARRIEAGLQQSVEKLKVEGIFVERAGEVYSEKTARSQAASRKAAVVIYGWYDDAGVNPRFELVKSPQVYLPVLRQSAVELANLDRLEIRVDKELKEMTFIAAATIGLSYFADGQSGKALPFFDLALQSTVTETRLLGREAVHFYKASSHALLHQYPLARAALQEAVKLRPDFAEAHHNLAIAYNGTCERAAALREAEEAARLKPDSAGTQQLRGLMLSSLGRWAEAAEAYQKALRLAPDSATLHSALAEAYTRLGRSADAATEQQKALTLAEGRVKSVTDDPEAIAAQADALLAQSRLDEAAAAYQQAIERARGLNMRADRLAWLYRSLGLTRWNQQRWDEMIAAYDQAMALSPGLYTDDKAVGVAYQAQGKGEQAVAAFQRALSILPCDANTHSLLGKLYADSGRSDEALRHYREALKSEPEDAVTWHAIAGILDQQGKTDESRSAYLKAVAAASGYLEHDPLDADITYLLGLTYFVLEDYRQAIVVLERAVALRPDAASRYALASAYYEARDYQKALSEYQAAFAADPKDAASAAGLGKAYARVDRLAEAAAAYRQSLMLRDDYFVRYSLAAVLERQGQYDAAAVEYQASLRLKDDFLTRVSLASLYERTARPDQAITEYRAAVNLRDEPEPRVSLARLYERQGRLEEAAAEYRAAIPLFKPEGPYRDSSRAALASVLARLCRVDEGIAALQPSLGGGPTGSVEVMAQLAGLYEVQGKTAEADKVYSVLLRENAALPGVHFLAGWSAYRQDRLSEAIKEMEQATQLAAPFSIAWSSLGYFHDLRGDLAAASQAHEAALKALPSNVSALSGLGAIALQQGKPDVALGYFQEALRQQPAFSQALPDDTQSGLVYGHLNLAIAYERLGRTAEAARESAAMLDLARKVAASSPTYPQAQFQLGLAYWFIGDTAGAQAAFAEAIRCDASLAAERQRLSERIRKLRGR